MKPHGRIPANLWGGCCAALGFLVVGATLGLAEEVVLTTYFPSPRGIYEELRTVLMRFHDTAAPPHIVWQWRVVGAGPTLTLRLQRTNPDGTPALGGEHLTVTDTGNVGLGIPASGIPAPSERLDVNGDVRVRGDLICDDPCIELGTETIGPYVKSIAAGPGIAVTPSGGGSTYTIQTNVDGANCLTPSGSATHVPRGIDAIGNVQGCGTVTAVYAP